MTEPKYEKGDSFRAVRDVSNLAQSRRSEEAVERLRAVVKKSGGNKRVAERCGVPLSTFSGYLAGREMKLSVASRIAEICGVTMEWLAHGRDPESIIPHELRDVENITDYETGERHSIRNVVEFPKYETRVSAGHGSLAYAQQSAGFVAIPRIMLPQHLQNATDHIIGLYVTGDSMVPTLTDGDIILVDTMVQSVRSGAIYAISNDDEILVKRLQRHLNGDIEVISDNPRYQSQMIDAETARRLWAQGEAPLKIIGRVVWRGGAAPV